MLAKPDNLIIVIFGASGDLTNRKLIPALFELYKQELMPENFAIVGTARSQLSQKDFHSRLKNGVSNPDIVAKTEEFLEHVYYLQLDPGVLNGYHELKSELSILAEKHKSRGNYIFYLSTPPSVYGIIAENLALAGLSAEDNQGWKRIIIEKPFGIDYSSAKSLNNHLLKFFNERQLYRIDHYLGKETVQNLLVTRFSNGIFEPLWNRNFIHHVEITAAESIGVEDRGSYYDHSGALRDMIQNHLLQVAALVAMEPPSSMDDWAIRNETLKVFQSLRHFPVNELDKYVIRGQYTKSHIKGKLAKGYREESNVDPESRTETFAAIKFYIDNWRWGDVPFYIRTGKRLPTRVSEVVIHFKSTPHRLFVENQEFCNTGNQLVIRIQPDEGILLKFGMKVPGTGFNVKNVNMDFRYKDLGNGRLPDAYERLLLDCMQGDATLYARGDAVDAAWNFVQPILDYWKNHPEAPLFGYPAGSWGPDVADDFIEGKNINWRYPCKNLADDGVFCEL
ncbi:MAG: glucose-6-phosphate dehydrogenase [Cyclobacteriaceae bacterium]|nr:glucose-6-phosphate dehydrogenase [Cyclobacteriaceae bacterium]